MATAVHIMSESSDHYIFCFDETLTEAEALDKIENDDLCAEERDYWCDWHHTNS